MDHVVTVTAYAGPRLGARCSCGAYVLSSLTRIGATLDELNRLAHEHIEAADRAPLIR